MSKPLDALRRFLAANAAAQLAIAYSGGLDSSVLLHSVATLSQESAASSPLDLRVVHVDHGLLANSARWAEHCAAVADALGLSFCAVRVEVDLRAGLGLEAAARKARYAAFQQVLPNGTLLLTAHHQDDQCETLLLKLLRGAGTRGLSGMAPLRKLGALLLGRPFLTLAREDLLEYARFHGLAWLDDPSNTDQRYARNRIRHSVLPAMREIAPNVEQVLVALAGQARADRALLEAQAHAALARCQGLDGLTLSLAALEREPAALRAWVLRAWLATYGHFESVQPILSMFDAKHDRQPEVRLLGASVRRFQNALYLLADCPQWEAGALVRWDAQAELSLPHGLLSFDKPVEKQDFIVRLRQGGERLRLPGRSQHSALKDLFQSLSVPPWERNRVPLLFSGRELVAVAGICASAEFVAWQDKTGARLVWTGSRRCDKVMA